MIKNNTNKEPVAKSRAEKFFTRGLPAIIGAAAVTFTGYMVAQSVTHQQALESFASSEHQKDQAIDDFNKMLDELSVRNATPDTIIENSAFSIPDNRVSLGGEAMRVAGLTGSNTELIADSALAISTANLIQPGSEFVLAKVDAHDDGTADDVIVQRAPKEIVNG